MPSTNFLQWNPGSVNQENDSAYLADPERSGGATIGSIFGSPVGNKLFYQTSSFSSAFAQALVNKGFTVNDAPYASLVSVLANVITSADLPSSIVLVSYAGSIAFNSGSAAAFDLTLTGDVSSSTLTGTAAGQVRTFVITQDAAGGRTFSWPSTITSPSAICSLPNSTSIQTFLVRAGGSPIVPYSQMLWVTSAGLIIPPNSSVVPISSNGNVATGYAEITEQVNATAGTITRTLYDARPFPGFKVNMQKADTTPNQVVTNTVFGQTINGYANWQNFTPLNSFTFQSNGSNWLII